MGVDGRSQVEGVVGYDSFCKKEGEIGNEAGGRLVIWCGISGEGTIRKELA